MKRRFLDQDYYLGDCLRLMVYESADSGLICTLPDTVNLQSSHFCQVIHQVWVKNKN